MYTQTVYETEYKIQDALFANQGPQGIKHLRMITNNLQGFKNM